MKSSQIVTFLCVHFANYPKNNFISKYISTASLSKVYVKTSQLVFYLY